ncbi:MAG: response regulator [Myxococcota bacterium]|nr:response regulator [Myxococcota bacterium]
MKALVLVVEDNEDIRNIITTCLRRNGYAVVEASDGQAAIETLSDITPNLILLDVLLPRLDGIEVLKRLREEQASRDIPVVMMSAVLQTRDLKTETAKFNVASFIQKPFQMRTLLAQVESAYQSRPLPTLPLPVSTSDSAQPQRKRRLQMVQKEFTPRGTLDELPVPLLLHTIFAEQKTGRLQICADIVEKTIFFQNGLPVYAESSIPEETLGSHLLKQNRISRDQHQRALEEMTNSGRHFGEILLKLGFLGPHELFAELEAHLTEKVITAFGWFKGSYSFTEGNDWKDGIIVAKMKPGRILITGVQRFWNARAVQERLSISKTSRTFPLGDAPYSEEQLGLSTREMRIQQMVRRGLSVGEVVRDVSDPDWVLATLYAMYIMGSVGFLLVGDRLNAPMPPPSVTSGLFATKREKDTCVKTLLAEYVKYRTADYFKLLGVARDATDEEIKQAFEARQQRYHPDMLVGVDAGHVHDKIEELYVRIHNAFQTLADPETRRRYIADLDEKMTDIPQIAPSKMYRSVTIPSKSEQEVTFEAGLSLLRNGEYKQARESFLRAYDINGNPQYRAYEVWAAFLAEPVNEKNATEQALLTLQKQHPEDALYPYILGNVALKQKNIKKAIAFYERAIRIDPQHIDSARQLRVLKMRQRSSEVSGLFDLFKKK